MLLNDRFRLLRGSGRGGIERHQTLRAAVSWSYELLDATERALFDCLSVFPAQFVAASAVAVADAAGLDELDVLDALSRLVDKSMVTSVRTPEGARYRLLETLRQFGEERLAEDGLTAEARDRHLAHVLHTCETAGQQWFGPDQLAASAVLRREWDNLRAAFAWALANSRFDDALRLLMSTGADAGYRLNTEIGALYNALVELSGEHASDWALLGQTHWDIGRGDLARAERTLRRVAASETNPLGTISARARMSDILARSGRNAEAERLAFEVERDVHLFPPPARFFMLQFLNFVGTTEQQTARLLLIDDILETYGSPPFLEPTRCALHGWCEFGRHDDESLERAMAWFARGSKLGAELGNRAGELASLNGLAMTSAMLARPDAPGACESALDRLHEISHRHNYDAGLEATALALNQMGRGDAAAVLVGHLEALHPRSEHQPLAQARVLNLQFLGGRCFGSTLPTRFGHDPGGSCCVRAGTSSSRAGRQLRRRVTGRAALTVPWPFVDTRHDRNTS